jgi:PAS domain S-box-containing protein
MTAKKKQTNEQTSAAMEELQAQLAEAQETLRAIREGEVDAVIVSGSKGEQVFSLVGAESIYRLIVETMKEAAFTVAFDGKILFCNAQFSEFIKRPMEQILGHALWEFVDPANRSAADALLTVAQEQPIRQRLVFADADGGLVPAHISANILNQPDGLSICVVATDLTELENSTQMIQQLRRQQEALQAANEELAATEEELKVQNEELLTSRAELQQSRARYQDLFETAPDGYISTDAEGIIQKANQAAARMFGCAAADLKGNPFSALLPMSERENYLNLLAHMNSGEKQPPRWELELRPSQGGMPFWASVAVAASRNEEGSITGLRWLIRDVTERKHAEEATLRHSATLEGINKVLGATLACETEEALGIACLEVAEELTQSKFGFIGDINEKGLEDIAISNPGWDACVMLDADGHRAPVEDFKIHGIYGRVISSGKGFFTNDPAHHPDRIGLPPGHPPLESFLGVPLIREGRTVGIIAVGNRPGGYSSAQQQALEAVASAIVEAFIRKRQEAELMRARDELEQRVRERTEELAVRADQLRSLAGELTLAEQRERKRLAKVLHDHIQQLLVAAKFRVVLLGRGENDAIKQSAKETEGMIDECIAASRSLTAELSPYVLHEAGLNAGLEWLARWMEDKQGFSVNLGMEAVEPVPEMIKILLFESVRELLLNAVKHSHTYSARVDL